MRKTLSILLAVMFAALLTVLSLASDAAVPSATAEKDGLSAVISADDTTGHILVKVRNLSSEYAGTITVSLSSSDGIEWLCCRPDSVVADIPGKSVVIVDQSDPSGPFDLEIGEEQAMTFIPLSVITETNQYVIEKSGCFMSSRPAAAVISLVSALCLALCFKGTKLPRRFLGILLVAVTVLTAAVLPVGAADTVRSFTVSIETGGRTVSAEISYHHNFKEKEVARSTGMERFEITYFWGPHGNDILNEEYIKKIAECGFTSIPMENNTVENNKAALTLLKKYGLTCSALWDWRINDLVHSSASFTQERVDEVIREVIADYGGYDNLRGYLITDEPSEKLFPRLGMITSAIHRLDHGRSVMINLYPITVSSKTLGSPSYEKHIDALCTQVDPDYISYDQYVFWANGKYNMQVFNNLETVRAAGLKHGKDCMQIVLLTKHSTPKNNYGDLTPTQIMWEVNLDLVYGMKRISYFTFWLDKDLMDDGWTNSCMNYLGEVYPHYYDVQKINKWLMPIGRELFDKMSTAVFHLGTTIPFNTVGYTPYGDLGEIYGDDAVIGFFDDESFMIVNKNYQDGAEYERKYTLKDHRGGLEYFDTDTGEWRSADGASFMSYDENGCCVLTIAPAAALLLRVKK